jgi:N-carbamoylputrescine amidase
MIQMACSEDRIENLKKCLEMIDAAAQEGANVVCLQELFCSTYFPQYMNPEIFKYAEIIPGKITESLQKAAQKLSIYIVVPLFEKEMSGLYYNSTIVIDNNGQIIGKYRKNHIPDEPLYYEKYYFKPGNLKYPVFDTPYAKIGIGICWDQWFPETGRILALKKVFFQH